MGLALARNDGLSRRRLIADNPGSASRICMLRAKSERTWVATNWCWDRSGMISGS